MNKLFLALSCAGLLAASAHAQWFNVTTVAGATGQGSADSASTNALFNQPGGLAMDSSGNIFVADTANHTIRKLAANGSVSTLAGSPGIAGNADGTNALFNSPSAVAADGLGNVYVADTGNFTIRIITPGGTVSTLAGVAGVPGSADGTNSSAQFFEPEGIAVDGSGNVFVADTWNHTIRKITAAGVVTTFAGSPGTFGSADGSGTNALFYEPQGITVDGLGNVFVTDTGNDTIRQVTSLGAVTTLAGSAGNFGSTDGSGTNALFDSPQGISVDAADNLYVTDALNQTIREVTSGGLVTTIAGLAGNFGSADGTNGSARFWGAQGIAVNPTNSGFLCLADTGNATVRQLLAVGTNWVSGTLAGSTGIGSQDATGGAARFFWPMSAAVDASGNLFVADAGNHTIRKITPAGAVSTVAGSPGIPGNADGDATSAQFNSPQAVALDASGNLFVSDTGNGTIREITPAGNVSTLAGSPGNFGSADGTNSAAQFFEPEGIVVDASNNVFVADTLNHTIREITPTGVVTTLAGTAGKAGAADGANGTAQFNRPTGLALDGAGDLFVTDLFNHTIREVTSAGVVSTLAGGAGILGYADGTNGAARFFEPEGIAVSGASVYVADAGNHALRQLTPAGTNWVVSTIAGWPGISGSADGSGIAARFCYPAGLAVKDAGNLFVADAGNNTIRSGWMITNSPPMIVSQPQNQAVNVGTTVTFGVGALGSGPLYYQWQFDGTNLPGATASSFTLSRAQPGNAGSYSVLVSSPTGSSLSSNAVLAVYAPPVITNQPASQTCLQGATVTFSVVAGPPPLTYQWRKNGAPLPTLPNVSGATSATLTLSNVTTADSATYSVLINNGYGAVASAAAALTVFFVPPPDSVQPYAWWQLNEGTGAQAFDYSGNGHNGTLNSGASWTATGHAGNGVYFNATSLALLTLNNPFTLSANWTVALWVNRWESKSSSTLISGSSYALKLEQYQATNRVGYTKYGTADYPLNYVTPLDNWMHLAFVETSAGVSVYTNGVLAAANTHTTSLNATVLGCDLYGTYTDYLDATLDDVRIYSQALTAPQIANLVAYGRISPIPMLTLAAPTNGASFTTATNLVLAASVVSNAQAVASVGFYAGTNLLGQASTSPYQWTWTNVPTGNYLLTAQAVFNGANTANSPAVGIGVAPATNLTGLAFATTNGALQLSWPPDHTGWSLQAQTNPPGLGLTTNWTTMSGSAITNLMILPVVPTNSSVFYRLSYP